MTNVSDADGVYIGSHGGGLSYLSKRTGQIKNYTFPKAVSFSNSCYSLLDGKDGTLWVGSIIGLYSFDKKTGQLTMHPLIQKYPRLSSLLINVLYRDSKERIWIGTYFIPGPIGINLGMAHDPEKYYDNLSACSLCISCSDVCPVKVDLAEQIYKWRQDLDGLGKANTGKKIMSGGMKFLMERPALFNAALWAAPVINGLPRFMKYNDLDDWGKGRELPEFAKESFNEMWKKNKVQGKEETK